MKVNMTPNPLDVVTIHASQGDTEARQWEFELHNNGELIDTSGITEQLFFKAYKGGTEQLLPENTSTPTTSPFKGDIRYPQGLLNDQEFTYRQSPTESDGLAKITDVKGNTIVWNQLVQNGNFADTTNWTGIRGTLSASNNVLTYETTSIGTSNSANRISQDMNLVGGHKYLFVGEFMGSKDGIRIIVSKDVTAQYFIGSTVLTTANTWYKLSGIGELTTNGEYITVRYTNAPSIGAVGDKISCRNLMLIDLTQLGLDVTYEQFASYFPLSFYPYTQGELISFNGNDIKTVGKNILNSVRTVGTTYTISGVNIVLREDGSYKLDGTCTGSNVLNLVTLSGVNNGVLFPKGSYVLSGSLDGTSSSNVELQYYLPSIGSGNRSTSPISFTLNEPMDVAVRIYVNNGRTYNDVVYPMLRFADTEDSTFEPYTSSTLSLPISTYFPNGMKSAGNVYDELTESKAITRIGSVDLGTLTWSYDSTYNIWVGTPLPSNIKPVNPLLAETFPYHSIGLVNINELGSSVNQTYNIWVRNGSSTVTPSGLAYYELATPTEESITTASLVTEKGEAPLYYDDELIADCNETISSESGIFDAKIKLMDDNTIYSQKIQLHIERKPS